MAQSESQTSGEQHKRLRCAVYTRKSSDEGLEQSFNSLHAQRDACEAFIASQKHEGWVLLKDAYDDGGLSGGSMERPALQRLLADVDNGRIDIVVVYKVDRLTRSLADFAKLTERFDANGTSFVSVTQSFNTSTSMGRLTLNVLLSFAQFEREVAGERIRDKITLSKRRGMWMGGLPPLGYDGIDRKLVINGKEADTVRLIYRRYLEAGSIADLKRVLDAEGIVSKRRCFADGRMMGGVAISRGALYQILRNRLYCGQIAHRGEVHQGQHEAIIVQELWDKVQALLEEQGRRRRGIQNGQSAKALLAQRIFDAHGNTMSPTHSNKNGRRYHYYTSAPLVRGGRGKGLRVPAADLEELVAGTLGDHLRDPIWIAGLAGNIDVHGATRLIDAARELAKGTGERSKTHGTDAGVSRRLLGLVERLDVAADRITVHISRSKFASELAKIDPGLAETIQSAASLTICVPARLQRRGKQMRLVLGEVRSSTRAPDPELVALIGDAHRWFEDLQTGRGPTIAAIARRDRQQVSHVSRTLSLAFLAPDITRMILNGKQPDTLTPERLKAARPLPLDWNEQRQLLLG